MKIKNRVIFNYIKILRIYIPFQSLLLAIIIFIAGLLPVFQVSVIANLIDLTLINHQSHIINSEIYKQMFCLALIIGYSFFIPSFSCIVDG